MPERVMRMALRIIYREKGILDYFLRKKVQALARLRQSELDTLKSILAIDAERKKKLTKTDASGKLK